MSLAVNGLDDQEQSKLDELWWQYVQKLGRNRIRAAYYDSKYLLKSMGIAIPDELVNVEWVLGWPAKAVDVLADRLVLDGFVIPGGDIESLGISEMWSENQLDVEAHQAHVSALLHACAFISTSAGDKASGEPEIMMSVHSAMNATGIWDRRARRLSSALVLGELSNSGLPKSFEMFLPHKNIAVTRKDNGKWDVRRYAHRLDHVSVVPLRYRPRLERPLGSSRLSRPVMSITDSSLRTVARTEVNAEFFASVQRWIMGADEQAFVGTDGQQKSRWEATIGKWFALGRDDMGDTPTVGEFSQPSMQPHFGHLDQLAKQFCGETNIPPGELGVIQDNPESASARQEGRDPLLVRAEQASRVFRYGWRDAVLNALQMRDNLSSIPDEWRKLDAKYLPAAMSSPAALADSVLKQVQAFPWMRDSSVMLEQMGYDELTIRRLEADKRRASGSNALDRILDRAARRGSLNGEQQAGETDRPAVGAGVPGPAGSDESSNLE